jgi:hypothetical protein
MIAYPVNEFIPDASRYLGGWNLITCNDANRMDKRSGVKEGFEDRKKLRDLAQFEDMLKEKFHLEYIEN